MGETKTASVVRLPAGEWQYYSGDGRVGIGGMRRNGIISWDLVNVHGRVNQTVGEE